MCLYTSLKKPNIAQEDIVCYKFLKVSKNGHKLYAPYTQKFVCRTKNIIGHTQRPRQLFCIPTRHFSDFEITKGAVHVNAMAFTATELIFCLNLGKNSYELSKSIKVFKCIIPKGTKYWVGRNRDMCSRKIRYIEELTSESPEIYPIIERLNLYNTIIQNSKKQIQQDSQKKKRKRKAKR